MKTQVTEKEIGRVKGPKFNGNLTFFKIWVKNSNIFVAFKPNLLFFNMCFFKTTCFFQKFLYQQFENLVKA